MPDTLTVDVSSSERRRRRLVQTKRRATALLALVSAVFVAVTVWGGNSTWAGYVQATAVASMVGGLADWFAVTALFRRPLRLPIPHTAIVVERKEQFGATLGEFIQNSFLTPEVIVERLRAARIVDAAGSWLARPANAARVAGEVADAVVAVGDLLRQEEVQRSIDATIHQVVEAVPAAPLAGRVLRIVTDHGELDDFLDWGLGALNGYVGAHRDELRQHLSKRSRRWLPGVIDHKLFDRVLDGVSSVLEQMEHDRDHDLRRQLREQVEQLIVKLETSPVLRARGDQLVRRALASPEARRWTAELWGDVKGRLRSQASDPSSALRQKLTSMAANLGVRLQEDPALASRVEGFAESVASYAAEHFNGAIAGMVATTIARWDSEETANRLEVLLGPDLQYVRINGTVMGAAAGLLLHVVARTLS